MPDNILDIVKAAADARKVFLLEHGDNYPSNPANLKGCLILDSHQGYGCQYPEEREVPPTPTRAQSPGRERKARDRMKVAKFKG